jgi:hypothetical protein
VIGFDDSLDDLEVFDPTPEPIKEPQDEWNI